MDSMIEGESENISIVADDTNVPVEQDTTDIEDIVNLFSFVAPSSEIMETSSNVGVYYSRSIFEGWVKQPSACCGASSVAGAWNALCGIHRSHPFALNHSHVLDVYRDIMRERVFNKIISFERKLGAKLDDLFWSEFESLASSRGKVIGGKKGKSVTKKLIDPILRDIVKDHLSRESIKVANTENDCNEFTPLQSWEAFFHLYKIEGIDLSNNDTDEVFVQVPLTDDGDDDESEGGDEEIPSISVNSTKWNWRNDFHELIRAKAGLLKLGGDKPTTAPIGNWGILESVNLLSQSHGLGNMIHARLFMGKKRSSKSKVDVPLSSRDNDETICSQWDFLKSAFMRIDHVLLFHLTNHYALIFAIREWWNDEQQQPVRQILTARRGQRPSAWIDFSEARSIMLGWEGYKIIAVSTKVNRDTLRREIQKENNQSNAA